MIKFLLRCSFSLMLLIGTGSVFGLQISSDTRAKRLSQDINIIEDADHSLKIKALIDQHTRLEPIADKSANLGYSTSTYWAWFTIDQVKDSGEYFLELGYPLLDYVTLYLVHKGKLVQKIEAGDMLEFDKRQIKHHDFVFPLQLETEKQYKVFLQVKSTSALQLPLTLWSSQQFLNAQIDIQKGFGIYYGIILVMILYNLFLFAGIKDRAYLYYILFLTGYLFFLLGLNGIGFQYFFPGYTWWVNNSLPFFICFGSAFGLRFAMEFLNFRNLHYRLFKNLYYYFIAGLVVSVISLLIPYRAGIMVAIIFAALSVLLLVSVGVYSLRTGYRAARFYVIAWFFPVMGIVIYILKTLTLLPNNFFTEYAIQMGSAIEVVLLSLALADRVNQLKKEKEQAGKELIESQENSLRIQQTMLDAFSRFVPREFLNLLGNDDITKIELGDHVQKKMSIFFSDIRSFTTLSETMTPQENFRFLNSYLKRMAPVIRSNHGFIDKFIGDAIMALFPMRADDALAAAVEMQKEIRQYNEHRSQNGYAPIDVGMGLHTGNITLGTIGANDRLEGTVISDTVNVAARVETLTKKLGACILVTEKIMSEIADRNRYKHRYIGKLRIKGKTEQSEIFEIFEGDSYEMANLKLASKDLFEMGVKCFYNRRFTEAITAFESVLEKNPEDSAALYYLRACERRAGQAMGMVA